MDTLTQGLSKSTNIRFAAADVTMTAKALEARHLSGPTAGCVLAEATAAAALLILDSPKPEEAVSIHARTSGPVTGFLVEATGTGDLRGFTYKKVLNEMDGDEQIDPLKALGETGTVQIMRTLPGKILNQAQLKVDPPSPRTILARFFNHSMQIPTAVEILAHSDSGGLGFARAIMAQRMPDGDVTAFVNVLEAFSGAGIRQWLAEPHDTGSFDEVVGLGDIEMNSTTELRFQCRCSIDKIEEVIRTLPPEERRDMLDQDKSHSVTCHMCSEDYTINSDRLRELVEEK
ncbi:MAG: Hsp33 family molecular chaperone HslO [Kiritimatiellia bacterium]|jgi:molecular chaperone Hsp33|nr:Hsp33 family molecular chaperone HslO [Kiritimatiellia bacterium]MDP6847679.1 Hsp33 family molecular chaperone HslO [Kiritimatiellia bacterium]